MRRLLGIEKEENEANSIKEKEREINATYSKIPDVHWFKSTSHRNTSIESSLESELFYRKEMSGKKVNNKINSV